jgi:hypothetical protein
MRRRLHQGANTFKVLQGIHAGGGMVGFHDANPDAVGERAELFERLDNLEGRGSHGG